MTQNQMSEEQISQKLEELNAQSNVEEARTVEFLGETHVHIDYSNGNIGVVSPDGTNISVYPC